MESVDIESEHIKRKLLHGCQTKFRIDESVLPEPLDLKESWI